MEILGYGHDCICWCTLKELFKVAQSAKMAALSSCLDASTRAKMGGLNQKRPYENKATEESVNSMVGKKAVCGETGTGIIES